MMPYLTVIRRHAMYTWITKPSQRAYLAGIGFSAFFIRDVMPAPWSKFSFLLFLPLLLHLGINGIKRSDFVRIPAIAWLLVGIAALHVFGLMISDTAHRTNVLYGVLVAVFATVFFLVSREPAVDHRNMVAGFFDALIPLAVAFAALALVKTALLDRGLLFGFLAANPQEYPRGSSLRSDYNLFGMAMIVAAIGLVRVLCERTVDGKNLFGPIAGLAIITTVIVLTGSRRTLLGLFIIPLYWMVLVASTYRSKKYFSVTLAAAASIAALTFILVGMVQHSPKVTTYRVLDWQYAAGQEKPSKPEIPAAMSLSDSRPEVILSTMKPEYAFGFQTRIDRWKLAKQMIAEQGWRPGGFYYHEIFGCRFVSCNTLDYPHMPLMSEWLIGGVVGGVVGAALYAVIFLTIWLAGMRGWETGITPTAIAVIPFSLISGDTLFSIPQLLVAALLLHGVAPSAATGWR